MDYFILKSVSCVSSKYFEKQFTWLKLPNHIGFLWYCRWLKVVHHFPQRQKRKFQKHMQQMSAHYLELHQSIMLMDWGSKFFEDIRSSSFDKFFKDVWSSSFDNKSQLPWFLALSYFEWSFIFVWAWMYCFNARDLNLATKEI